MAEEVRALSNESAEAVHKTKELEASSLQVSSFSEIAKGMEQISTVVQSTAATSEESSASSEELAAHSQILSELVGNFVL